MWSVYTPQSFPHKEILTSTPSLRKTEKSQMSRVEMVSIDIPFSRILYDEVKSCRTRIDQKRNERK